jgi:hypothetical protein
MPAQQTPVAVLQLYQGQLPNAIADLYVAPTVPPNSMVQITSVWICNADTAARTVTFRLGVGALTAANSLLEAALIPANTSWFICAGSDIAFVVPAGAKIQGLSDVAAKVTVTICGQVQT